MLMFPSNFYIEDATIVDDAVLTDSNEFSYAYDAFTNVMGCTNALGLASG